MRNEENKSEMRETNPKVGNKFEPFFNAAPNPFTFHETIFSFPAIGPYGTSFATNYPSVKCQKIRFEILQKKKYVEYLPFGFGASGAVGFQVAEELFFDFEEVFDLFPFESSSSTSSFSSSSSFSSFFEVFLRLDEEVVDAAAARFFAEWNRNVNF